MTAAQEAQETDISAGIRIPHSRPTLGAEEAAAAARVVASGQVAAGEMVRRFESALAAEVSVAYAAAVSSGTAALHLALTALGVRPGDEVVIPSYVCCALLNAVYLAGALPVLAEIDPDSGNLDPGDVGRRLTRHTRAIIAPHMFGLPTITEELANLGVPVVEDCAQSVGARRGGRAAGGLGRVAVYSFYATKVMTTGEGGMVISDDRDLIERVRDLRDYDQRPEYRRRYNYKMTDIQAAIGLVQLRRLPEFIRRRREIAASYRQQLSPLGFRHPPDDPGHIYFRYVVRVAGGGADAWIQGLHAAGIGAVRPVFMPLHRYLKISGFERTESAWKESVSLPIYPRLGDRELGEVTAGLADIRSEATDERNP